MKRWTGQGLRIERDMASGGLQQNGLQARLVSARSRHRRVVRGRDISFVAAAVDAAELAELLASPDHPAVTTSRCARRFHRTRTPGSLVVAHHAPETLAVGRPEERTFLMVSRVPTVNKKRTMMCSSQKELSTSLLQLCKCCCPRVT